MARAPRVLRLLIIIVVLVAGITYVNTFHREYVKQVSGSSIKQFNEIIQAKLGEKNPEAAPAPAAPAANAAAAPVAADKQPVENMPAESKPETPEPAAENKPAETEPKEKPKAQAGMIANDIPAPSVKTEVGPDYVRANATFVSLARNEDVWELVESIRHVEDRFNKKFKYDWVFINDKPFDDNFKKVTTSLISGKTHYEIIPKEYWSYPDWIDKDRAALTREQMREKKIIYGDSVSYRHMCRFESGFFWRVPAMNQFKYYWRVEPGIKLYCDIDYDVFKFMHEKKIRYGFTISLYEYVQTIETLWATTKKFLQTGENKKYLAPDNLMDFVSDDKGENYNLCHFWSNFEVGDLDFWRSDAYREYFKFLDQEGGFFYERWGDAPVHSIAAALFLNKNEIHHFEDIGYFHPPFHHCPTTLDMRTERKCMCNPEDNFAWKGYSCTPKFYKASNLLRPAGWSDQAT